MTAPPDFELRARELVNCSDETSMRRVRAYYLAPESIAAALEAAHAAGIEAGRAVAEERTYHESAKYVIGYAQAVRRAGHEDTAKTLEAVAQSLVEAAGRARAGHHPKGDDR